MDKIRHIVFTVTNDLTYDQRMHKISKSMANSGYKVTLVGRKLPKSVPFQSPFFEHKRIKCIFTKGKLFYIEYNLRLLLYLIFKQFDIISAVDLDTLVPCVLAGKMKGKFIAYDAHEYFTEVPEVINRPVVMKIWEWTAKYFIPETNLRYTVGTALANVLSQKYNCAFETIRSTPYLSNEKTEISIPEKKFILYQGALNKSRGIEQMIKACKMTDLEFHIIGEGDLSEELRKLVKKEGLEKKVFFLGYMLPEQLKIYSGSAYLGLNVSENTGLSYYYSLNNKFFDYIHAGLPALLNKFPEYMMLNNEIETCILADSNPEDLAAKINEILKDPERYLRLKRNCLLASQKWNWQKEEIRLKEIYDNIS